jgi:polysaccharide export outer membrane protein
LVDVTVFDTPELSQKARVDGTGVVTLALGTRVPVAGLTTEEANRAIETALSRQQVLREPHVSLLVLEYATQGVSVMGEVKNPGVYPMLGSRTLLDIVSAAGGFLPTASNTVSITHQNGGEEMAHVSAEGVPGNANTGNPWLQPGDRVVVRRGVLVYVLGDVGKPGGYVTESSRSLTALQAIALAQGMNKTAQMKATLIRTTPTGRTDTLLALKRVLQGEEQDPVMQEGDILFIPVSGAKEWTAKGISSMLQMAVGVVVYGAF